MLASGVANTISAPFLCYISGPSLARIWIVDRAGGTTQVSPPGEHYNKELLLKLLRVAAPCLHLIYTLPT